MVLVKLQLRQMLRLDWNDMAINTEKDQVTRFELASIMGDDQDEDNEDFSDGI